MIILLIMLSTLLIPLRSDFVRLWKTQRSKTGGTWTMSMKTHHDTMKRQSSSIKVICGDCRSKDAYTSLGLGKGRQQQQANVLLTDPPYCILERRRKGGDLRDDKGKRRKVETGAGQLNEEIPRFASVKDFTAFTRSWIEVCINEALTPDATLVIWMNGLGQGPVVSVCQDFGYSLIGEYIWAKETARPTRPTGTVLELPPTEDGSRAPAAQSNLFMKNKNEVLLRCNEVALIFKPRARELSANSHNIITTSVITDNSAATHPHPCNKPLAAMLPLVDMWTKPNDVILDPFTGSAGILKAVAERGQGRKGLGIEIIQKWVDALQE